MYKINANVNGNIFDVISEQSGIDESKIARKNACLIKVNGKFRDLRDEVKAGDNAELHAFEDSPEAKKTFWHTASHILAQAVKRLYPSVKLAIGPAIDNGFYYDFEFAEPFTSEDLPKIEAEIKKIVKENIKLERYTLPPNEAIGFLEEQNEPYKVELCREHAGKGENISFYKQGEFTDLCAGPHLMYTSAVKAVKLTSCTGAYWRGNEKNKMLTRIYGTAFPSSALLNEYLTFVEEAKKRDHRKLGQELNLFTIMNEGPGFPFFLPNGMTLKNTLVDYWRDIHTKAGYREISSPIMLTADLWKTSGHWYHYRDNMYFSEIDDTEFSLKPMNCPGSILVYKMKPHSYKELPLRLGELGIVHRHEKSGALHGLMRVRSFTQDDAHIFLTKEQIGDEIKRIVGLTDEVYGVFGFKYNIELSTMPDDHMGSAEDWESATNSLKSALENIGRDFVINEGDGAFYGPKIDFHLKDSIGRTWQCGTIQLDFQLPEKFELEYNGSDDKPHRPVMIHRVVYGSIERLIGILTEHFAGAFPLWLAPVQTVILPIADRHNGFAAELFDKLQSDGIRTELDKRSEKIGFKIREAQLKKIPYMLIIGDKETETSSVSVRSRKDGDIGTFTFNELSEKLKNEIKTKTLP
jgi:threonyl-tRNA synthetase